MSADKNWALLDLIFTMMSNGRVCRIFGEATNQNFQVGYTYGTTCGSDMCLGFKTNNVANKDICQNDEIADDWEPPSDKQYQDISLKLLTLGGLEQSPLDDIHVKVEAEALIGWAPNSDHRDAPRKQHFLFGSIGLHRI